MAYPIDIESETLQFEGEWYTQDELARLIRSRLEANDYAVGRPAAALEHLTQTLANLRTVALRMLPQMHERLNHESARQGRPVGALVRDAIAAYLAMPAAEAEPVRAATPVAPTGRRPTDPEISLPNLAETQTMEMPLIDDLHGTPELQAPVNGAQLRPPLVDYSNLGPEDAPAPRGDRG